MPDAHAGIGCTVGTTMTIKGKVVPNLVGVDIGCGMEVARIDAADIDCEKLDRIIRENIPSGFEIREKRHPFAKHVDIDSLRCARRVNLEKAYMSVGTLGGGNHFIEADVDVDGGIYIVVHSGSRHLGLEVAEHYQNEGHKRLNEMSNSDREKLIEQYKLEGKSREIGAALKAAAKQKMAYFPRPLAYVSDDLFDNYIHDMKKTQQFADVNRRAMMQTILSGLGVNAVSRFTTVHNYIDTDAMILRKGAVSARTGEKLIIPMNMRDGSLICVGLGNEEWNFSAPHGAGRLMSRSEARQTLSLADYRASVEGIYSTSVNPSTIDEAPMAYKPMDDIIRHIGDTVDIVARIRPIYNFKASEGTARSKRTNHPATT
jgi:RNA-splicing ligase RtcB